jgi:lipopolysaccharide export LptBFGC system permease protein LptF
VWALAKVCAKYYAAITPLIYCQVLGPVVAVSAALFSVTTLQRSNEFVPLLASGRSYQRAFVPILAASLGISVGIFFVQEFWIPRTVSAVREASESRGGNETTRHVKYLDKQYGNLIVMKEYERYRRRAKGVDVLPVAPSQKRAAVHSRPLCGVDRQRAGRRDRPGVLAARRRHDSGV